MRIFLIIIFVIVVCVLFTIDVSNTLQCAKTEEIIAKSEPILLQPIIPVPIPHNIDKSSQEIDKSLQEIPYGSSKSSSQLIASKPEKLNVYIEDENIKNKGFINELINQPPKNFNVDNNFYYTKSIRPDIPLNPPTRYSHTLPYANINVNCL